MKRHLITAFIIWLPLCTAAARPPHFTEAQAIHAIAMEASGEGFKGMLAVAAALRNRGTLQGVCGRHATRKESRNTLRLARTAWLESRTQDPTHGATHWANQEDLKTGIFDCMKTTARIGNHTFFKN